MENNYTNPNRAASGQEIEKASQKKVYHAPQLRSFGGLTELTQLVPARGHDGCTNFADCTFT
jgi:hypothetical protein